MARHTSSSSSSRTRLLAVSCLLCLMLVRPAPVLGVRRTELLMAPGPAPAPAAGRLSAGIDTTTKRFAAATLDAAAAQMSKWRVRRGSDPIHNRS
ncbi:hypothetical protein BRADI_1g61145v3 [Brachypodium distachyon]|uniref:Uncharacterized protein n=1 Tax=Brachypodium distachyon TaxID=15368 RepID=A0A0Q3S926_BRADI|nr:hypothetical protein BRADI_1g61145v3 [Brachypodium distachyon]